MSDHDDRELMDVDTRSRSPQSNSSKSSGPMSRSSSKSRSRSRSLSRSRSRSRSLSRSSPSPARPTNRDTRSRSHSPDRRRSHRERHSPVARQRVFRKQRQYINTSSDRENPEPSTCLGIFGLAKQTDERDIRRVFGRYGRLVDVKIVYDGTSGRSRGFGFVTYDRVDEAAEAKRRCNGLDLDGRTIRVDFSVTQRAHTPTPGIYMGKMNRRNGDRAYDRGDSGGYRARDAGYDGGRKGGRGRDRDDVRGNGFGRRRSPDASTYGRGSRNDGGIRYSRSRSRSPPPRPRNYGRY